MGDYFLEPQARRDVRDIQEFVSDYSVAAAGRLMERLERGLLNLADNPLMGRERPDLAENLRSFLVEEYIIYYYPMEDGIEVARIVHGARDASRLF